MPRHLNPPASFVPFGMRLVLKAGGALAYVLALTQLREGHPTHSGASLILRSNRGVNISVGVVLSVCQSPRMAWLFAGGAQ